MQLKTVTNNTRCRPFQAFQMPLRIEVIVVNKVTGYVEVVVVRTSNKMGQSNSSARGWCFGSKGSPNETARYMPGTFDVHQDIVVGTYLLMDPDTITAQVVHSHSRKKCCRTFLPGRFRMLVPAMRHLMGLG